MRRRRRWLLLALVPAMLGAASIPFIWNSSGSNDESLPPSAVMHGAAPRAQQEEDSGDRPVIAIEGDVGNSAPDSATEQGTPQAPSIESAPSGPAQRPAHVEAGEAIGVPQLASTSTSADGPYSSGDSFRVASISGYAGGTMTSGPATRSGKPPSDNSTGDDAGDPDTNGQGRPADPTIPEPEGSGPADGQDGDVPLVPTPDEESPPQGGDSTDELIGGDQGGDESNDSPPPDFNAPPYDDSSDPVSDLAPPVQVPEPASLGLLLFGLLGCIASRRRR
jgi:hypothetical protein